MERASDITSVPAAILAGGLGTRLRSAVPDLPKVLAPVGGRPALAYLLDRLEAAGLRRVVLCTGYRGDQVRTAFGNSHGALSVSYSREPSPLGTAGALRLARPLLGGGVVLVLNGDTVCDVDPAAFLTWHRERGAEGSLALVHVEDSGRYGRVRIDDGGKITSFEEKAVAGGPGWINSGVYLLGPRVLESIPEGPASLERDVFPEWIDRGLDGYRHNGRFLDIGTPESYRQAESFFT